MARNKNEDISSAISHVDIGARTFKVIANAVADAGGGDDDLRLIETDRELRRKLAELIVDNKDCFQFTDERCVIQVPALPRLTLEELKARYSWIERIERDDSPVCPVTLRLATVLKSGEDSINGATYERRLVPRHSMLLGLQHRDWLVANQNNLPEPTRTALKALLGKIYLDFPGLIVVRGGGGRGFPYAGVDGERWSGYWYWTGLSLSRGGRVAVVGK